MIVAIIQARMGSKRFRGKVLKKIYNKPLILILIERLKKSRLINRIVVATSIKKNDDILYNLCSKKNIHCFRGPELDVLSRYYKCAIQHNATTVVRITADCPMIDPKLVDKIIKFFFRKKFDYVSNTTPLETSTWPNGSDVEVFSMQGLERTHKEAVSDEDREHVTFYFWKNAENLAFLRSLEGLAKVSNEIGDLDEAERCYQFLKQLDPNYKKSP